MKLGAMIYAARGAMDIVEFARVAEETGFDSVWQAEHSHRPITEAERAGWADWSLPLHARGHATLGDQMVILGAWAAATREVKLGTAITLVVERDPIWLAKEVATIDVLSGGRVLLGIGFNHPREPYITEMLDHGTEPRRRFGLMRERVLAMREIWEKEEAEFHGQHVDFGPMWSEPKPVQQPLPVLLGSSGGQTREQWERRLGWLLEYCNGWLPIAWEPNLAERVEELQARARELGKPRYEITVLWIGEREELQERHFDEYAEKGVDRIIFFPPWGSAEEIVPQLERYGALAAKYR